MRQDAFCLSSQAQDVSAAEPDFVLDGDFLAEEDGAACEQATGGQFVHQRGCLATGGQRRSDGFREGAQRGILKALPSPYLGVVAILPEGQPPSGIRVALVADVSRFAGAVAREEAVSVGGRRQLPDFNAQYIKSRRERAFLRLCG